jgi:hypothetical protein
MLADLCRAARQNSFGIGLAITCGTNLQIVDLLSSTAQVSNFPQFQQDFSGLTFLRTRPGTFELYTNNNTVPPNSGVSQIWTFATLTLQPGFYDSTFFVTQFQTVMSPPLQAVSIDPLNVKVNIVSSSQIVCVVSLTTLSGIMGIDSTSQQLLFSQLNNNSTWVFTSIGIVTFKPIRYVVLRCKEIEADVYREEVQGASGIGIFKIIDINDVANLRVDFTNFVKRPFHPIGKLSELTFRFENTDGTLADFNGNASVLILGIKRYMPKPKYFGRDDYILNPDYDPNFREWMIRDQTMKLRFNGNARRVTLPTVNAFVAEHNAHVRDPRRKLPNARELDDNALDSSVDLDYSSEDETDPNTKTELASSIWTGVGTGKWSRKYHDFFK